MLRIGWFSTGRDAAARQLLRAVQSSIGKGALQAEIIFVFSNREAGQGWESDLFLRLVNSYDIPLICLSSQKFHSPQDSWREEYHREVMRLIKDFNHQLCVLAGYMLIVSAEMCQRYNMLNLHPAPPGGPSGTWQEVIWKLLQSRASSSGVMMHLVTPELDQGPPVTFCTFPIRGRPYDRYWAELAKTTIDQVKRSSGESFPLFKLIRRQGVRRELPLMIVTLKAFAEGKVRIAGGRVVDESGQTISGYDLTPEIERELGHETHCL